MKHVKFYCKNYIECSSNIKKYQPPDCQEQCHACMDEIIDYHFNKKIMKNNTKILKEYLDGLGLGYTNKLSILKINGNRIAFFIDENNENSPFLNCFNDDLKKHCTLFSFFIPDKKEDFFQLLDILLKPFLNNTKP